MARGDQPASAHPLPFLEGDSEMAAMIRARDWSAHPFGPPDGWPQSLRSALGICLHSAFPTSIYWGPELRLLYNDAWASIPGPRHPAALGAPAREVWADIWHVIGPQLTGLLATGQGFFAENQMLPMRRHGVPEETYWSYSFTAIRDENGAIAGIFNSGSETTGAVLSQRQMAFVIRLGEALREAGDPMAACRRATVMLGEHLHADRVGFCEIGADGETVSISEEWTSERVSSLGRDLHLPDFGSHVGQVLARGRILRLNRISDDPELERTLRTSARRLDMEAALAVPWLEEGRLLAAIFVHCAEPRNWTDHDAATLQQALDWTWTAVQRARAAERETLMAREIDHRAKNALAVVQALARLTEAHSVQDYRRKVEARIAAVARSHSLLAAARWGAIDLHALAAEELGPFLSAGPPSVRLDGPALPLPPELAQTIALVLHELTTNAVKHGALSTPAGSLRVIWRVGEGILALDWVEEGAGDAAVPDAAGGRGFGSTLIARAVEEQLGGTLEQHWEGGLPRYRIAVPLQGPDEVPPVAGLAPTAQDDAPRPKILLAEDEPMVAMDLEERISRFGYGVFGTFGTVADGLAALGGGLPDAALLDANLCGVSSVPLAEALHGRGVPVVFATGYDRIDGLPKALATVKVLSKPIADTDLLSALEEAIRTSAPEPAGG